MWVGHLDFNDGLDDISDDIAQKEAVIGNQETSEWDELWLYSWVQQDLQRDGGMCSIKCNTYHVWKFNSRYIHLDLLASPIQKELGISQQYEL